MKMWKIYKKKRWQKYWNLWNKTRLEKTLENFVSANNWNVSSTIWQEWHSRSHNIRNRNGPGFFPFKDCQLDKILQLQQQQQQWHRMLIEEILWLLLNKIIR